MTGLRCLGKTGEVVSRVVVRCSCSTQKSIASRQARLDGELEGLMGLAARRKWIVAVAIFALYPAV